MSEVSQERNPDRQQEEKDKPTSISQSSQISPVYSIFAKKEKYFLMLVLSLVGFWSTTSSPIYFPALPTLSAYFDTSDSVMNLSVVAYLIFQGFAPTFSSSLADSIGRRPVILVSVLIYVASCIGISQTNVYWLLAVLRCIQALGIAPVIAISSGVAGDVCTAAERGGFVGIVAGFQLVGNGFGGLIGAALINSFDTWRSIFIFLAIGGGGTFFVAIFALPETARHFVGNGSIKPQKVINTSPILFMPYMKKRLTNDVSTLAKPPPLNLLASFKILYQREVICTLLPAGMQFACWTMVLASISTELESRKYNYSVMHVGYIYLPQGVACLLSSIVTGKVLDYNYRRSKNAYDKKYKDYEASFKPPFNIFKVRLIVLIVPAILMIFGLLIFGWCLEYKRNISSIIISTMMISVAASSFISAVTTMLVDLYPGRGSSSTSCMNLVRCWLAALFSGVLSNMINSLGLGGCYTLMAGLCILCDIALIVFLKDISSKLRKSKEDKDKHDNEANEENIAH